MVIPCAKGLDTVAFMMQVEDCFEISIPDHDVEKMKTVGDVFAYVRERVPANSSNECLTAKIFYRLRRALMHLTRRPRGSIRPDTALDDLLSETDRERQWGELKGTSV